jgi:hypothetical protein
MLTLEPRRRGKFRVPKSVVRALISVAVLLVLIIGAGVGYVWYAGRHPMNRPQTEEQPIVNAKKPDFKPIKPAPNAKESASIQSLTSPVAPGDNAMVTIHTLPDSVCTISVVYDKTASTDSGLAQKNADEYGLLSWTWTVEPTVPLGKWPVKISCAYDGKGAFVQGDLVVAKPVAN